MVGAFNSQVFQVGALVRVILSGYFLYSLFGLLLFLQNNTLHTAGAPEI